MDTTLNPTNKENTIETYGIQYVIYFDYLDEGGYAHIHNKLSFTNKEEANNKWLELKNKGCFNMEATTVEGKYLAVVVRFPDYDKDYTYLAKKETNAKYAVVKTKDGMKIVSIQRYYQTTRAELEKVLPFSCYQYIVGIVKEDK